MSIIKIKLPLDYRSFIDPYMILTHTGNNTGIIIRPCQYKNFIKTIVKFGCLGTKFENLILIINIVSHLLL